MKLFAYTMVWDTGFAPCVSAEKLTIACCKSNMRYTIAKSFDTKDKDIYVMGLLGKDMAKRQRLSECYCYTPLYMARISNIEKVMEYYADDPPNRADKKYLFKSDNWYIRKGNPHHPNATYKDGIAELTEFKKERDIMYLPKSTSMPKYNYVLESDRFVYFGKEVISRNDFNSSLIDYIAETRANSPRNYTIQLTYDQENELLTLFDGLVKKNINLKHKPYDGYFGNKDCKGVCGR